MSTSRSMKTLSEVLTIVQERGYTTELVLTKQGASFGKESNIYYTPQSLLIEKSYRFEGESDPGDMSVLHLITDQEGHKGFILNAYGTYSDQDNVYYDDFIIKIPTAENSNYYDL
jgi:hypothetical protein